MLTHQMFGWEKFFKGDTKVKIDVVDMFYATKFHPIDMYATMDVEKVSFHAEVINELYGLPDEAEMYLGHQLIKYPTKGIAKNVLKTIA